MPIDEVWRWSECVEVLLSTGINVDQAGSSINHSLYLVTCRKAHGAPVPTLVHQLGWGPLQAALPQAGHR